MNSGHYEAGTVKSTVFTPATIRLEGSEVGSGHYPGCPCLSHGPMQLCDAAALIFIAELKLTRVHELCRRDRSVLRCARRRVAESFCRAEWVGLTRSWTPAECHA